MHRLFRLTLVAIALLGSTAGAAELHWMQSWSVVLRYPSTVALGADDAERLKDKALEVLRSSNFNSTAQLWKWDEAKMNLQYAEAVSGRHLLVTFTSPEEIETAGGKVVVKEIVVGLNRPQYASSLHTIDDKGHVVGHGKYSGVLCVELLEMAKTLPNKTMEPTR